MDLRFGVPFFAVIFSILSKCQAWIPEYNIGFGPEGLYSVLDPLTPPLSSFGLEYRSSRFHQDNSLVLAKIYENQRIAYSLISSLENNVPCELRYSRNSLCNKVLPKEIYFADYPHVKALTQHQWKRLRNFLQIHKFGSLRINSPFYRP